MVKRRRDREAEVLAECAKRLAGHLCVERQSRSFDFHTLTEDGKRSFHYAHSLTWTPGVLSLAGDCGEMQLVHGHALRSLEGGLHWAGYSSSDYLLEKSDAK